MRCMSHHWIHVASICLVVAAGVTSCGVFPTKKKAAIVEQNDADLAGTWKGGCVAMMDWVGAAFHVTTMRFSPFGDFDTETALFSDPGCGTEIARLTQHGTFAALGSSSVAANANDLNLTVTEATLTPSDANLVDTMNGGSYCAVSDWQPGKATDILGKDCLGVQRARGDVIYEVYRVEDDERRLLIGRGTFLADREQPDVRPTTVDTSHPLIKQ